jgi:microcystin-dependent protein
MGTPYVGEIRMFGGNFAPVNWMFCNGQLLPISEYDTLFNLIGTTYGGDGQSTFALPNLQGRLPVHMGQGSGLSSYVIGQSAGVETVTLTTNQIPIHTHVPLSRGAGSESPNPAGMLWGATDAAAYATPPPSGAFMNAGTIGLAGGNQPHDNMPPYLTINFIISLFGIYPSPT